LVAKRTVTKTVISAAEKMIAGKRKAASQTRSEIGVKKS